jgi:hypothetical protein
VFSSVSLVLAAGVERLELLGGGHLDGQGNAANNFIIGNSGDNKLAGGSGDDMLAGGLGNDILIGGLGNDTLNGGGGDDILVLDRNDGATAQGGAGFDTVRIDALGPSLELSDLVGKVFSGVERIDLAGSHDNFLIVDPASIGANTLKITGDSGDTVVINGAWTKTGTFGSFVEYKNGAAIIQVESDVTVFGSTFDLSTLNGKNGFRLNGFENYDGTGYSVASAGDVNGDGFGDFIIGAYFSNAGGTNSGAAYVVFGKAGAFPSVLDLSTLDGTSDPADGADGGHETGYRFPRRGFQRRRLCRPDRRRPVGRCRR